MKRIASVLIAALFAATIQAVPAQEIIIIDDPGGGPRPIDPEGPTPPGQKPEGTPEQMTSVGLCPGAVCRIVIQFHGGCRMVLSPEWVFLTAENVRLLWEIKSHGYAFPEVNGITFKSEYNEQWAGQFVDSRRLNERTWTMRDLNTQPGAFRYQALILNKKTNEYCTIDPGLVNDWP